MLNVKFMFTTTYTKKEINAITMLLLLSFFMGIALAFFFTVSISSFLVNFSSQGLPYAYLVSGILSYAIWTLHRKIGRNLSSSTLIIVTLSFLLFSISLLTLWDFFYYNIWLSLLMFAWVSPFLFIKNICFWGLASKVFNLSQGKKVFGIISSGEVISNIVAFFSIPFLILVLNKIGLLIVSIFSILICLVLVAFIIRRYSDEFRVKGSTKPITGNDVLVKSGGNFFVLTLFFCTLPVFIFYFIDYMFLCVARSQFSDVELLAAFMGYFLGAVSLVELFFKAVVFNKILTYYGLKVGLLCQSVALLLATVLAIFAGTWMGESYIFFSVIALSKLLERSLGNGIHAPSLQIIYQPLPARSRANFQSNVEGISGAVGNLLAGGVLLFLSFVPAVNLLSFNYILLFVLAAWVIMTGALYRSYKIKLQEALHLKRKLTPTKRLMMSKEIFKKGCESKNVAIKSISIKLLLELEMIRQIDVGNVLGVDKMNGEGVLSDELSISAKKDLLIRYENLFARSTTTGEMRLRILELYYESNTETAKTFLLNKLEYPDREIQLHAIRILYALHYNATVKEQSVIREEIVETVRIITWLSACILDLQRGHLNTEACNNLMKSLRLERKEYFDSLYMLLSFMYGYSTVDLIKTNLLDKNDTESHIYAIEVAANTFDKDVVALITPWFENITLEKSISRLTLFFPQQQLSVMERAINILYGDYSTLTLWTKLTALRVLRDFCRVERARNEIIACLFHKEPLIYEMSWNILHFNNAEEVRFDFSSQFKSFSIGRIEAKTIFEKVQLLKGVPLFHIAPEYKLVVLASLFHFKEVAKGTKISCKGNVIVVLAGVLNFFEGNNLIATGQSSYTFIPGIHPIDAAHYSIVDDDSIIMVGDKKKILNCFFDDANLSKNLLKYAAEDYRLITSEPALNRV